MRITNKQKIARLGTGINHTGKRLVEYLGLKTFQDLLASGRLEYVKDLNEHKLYRIKI